MKEGESQGKSYNIERQREKEEFREKEKYESNCI